MEKLAQKKLWSTGVYLSEGCHVLIEVQCYLPQYRRSGYRCETQVTLSTLLSVGPFLTGRMHIIVFKLAYFVPCT